MYYTNKDHVHVPAMVSDKNVQNQPTLKHIYKLSIVLSSKILDFT